MLSFTRRTERKLRDRNSQLVVPNKSFARVRTICEQQLNLMRQPQHKLNQPSKPAPTPARVPRASHLHMLGAVKNCTWQTCIVAAEKPTDGMLQAPSCGGKPVFQQSQADLHLV